MRFLNELHEGDRISGIYLCKQKQPAVTKNGKPYENIILQDKTGVMDGKIWDPNSLGIDDFDALDYIEVMGDVTSFAGAMQLNIKRVRKAGEGEYNPADYLPVSENSTDDMYAQLTAMIGTVKNGYLNTLLNDLAKEIPDFPQNLENQLVHCILAHHGELEYGSPKKPAMVEAVALNLADNTDARMETLTEIFAADKSKKEWLGYNRLFESNLRKTGEW